MPARSPSEIPAKATKPRIIRGMGLFVVIAFVAILASLGAALYFMMNDGRDNKAKTSRMAWALALRVGLSVLLFVCLLLAWKFGYLKPTGVPVGR